MKELLAILCTVIFVFVAWTAAIANENNNRMKDCVQKSNGNWNIAARCYHKYSTKINADKITQLRKFLDENPRYRYPGQSDNRCFGKPSELAFEHINGSAGSWGWNVNIKYKDTIKPCIIGPFEEDPYAGN
jgi:hypothetical protein